MMLTSFEMMMALLHGVTLVVAQALHERLGVTLAEVVVRQRITHVTLVPSVLQTLPTVDLPDLKILLITADELVPMSLSIAGQVSICFSTTANSQQKVRSLDDLHNVTQPGQPVHIGQPIPAIKFIFWRAMGIHAHRGCR
ncbi:MAG: hypothetical protein R3E79_00255 [Caldilineaceae bacterium]